MNLPYRMRPQKLREFFGQEHLVGSDKILRKMLEEKTLFSMILWGPPGSGKTTLAQIISKNADSDFHSFSAVQTGKEDLRKIISSARRNLEKRKRTVLFIDEIHRWNKAQQDSLLPHVESGLITLIGATTENPSFEVISPLLSRCRVFVLKGLDEKNLEKILDIALKDKEKGLGIYKKAITKDAKELLIRLSAADARIMLNALEIAVTNFKSKQISSEIIKEVFQTKSAGLYDKKADEHYNIISAYIKSLRGSDPDAALYYLARMLENGEDPKFIARRMIILASEDIGLADRGALIQTNAAFEAVHKIGMPEAQLILAHATLYLATAKKSREVANALGRAKEAVYEYPNETIPLHLRNAPTKLMKNLGYAKNYTWSDKSSTFFSQNINSDHQRNSEKVLDKYVGPKENLSFLPERLKDRKFFKPEEK